jgi:hypothetical protein
LPPPYLIFGARVSLRSLVDTMYVKDSYVPWNFNGEEVEGVRGRMSRDSRSRSMEVDPCNRHGGSEQCGMAGTDVPLMFEIVDMQPWRLKRMKGTTLLRLEHMRDGT